MSDTFGKILKNEANCIVLGDFNFDNEIDYVQNITNYSFQDIIANKYQKDDAINDIEDFSFSMP